MIDPRHQTVAEWVKDYERNEEMGLKVKESGGNVEFKKVPQGTHIAVCNMVVDLGLQETEFQGVKSNKRQIYIRWEVPGERIEYEVDGNPVEGPMSIGKTYTASLNEKANLRKDLENWRNKTFTPDELNGFDIENVLGKPCQISVMHREANGNTYANVSSVTGLPKGVPAPEAENDLLYYDADNPAKYDELPKWIKEKIGKQVDEPVAPERVNVEPDDFDDDIPF